MPTAVALIPFAVAFVPYLIVCVVLMVGLEKVSIFRWTWEPPPLYIRIPVAILWPLYVLIILVYAALGKVNKS